MDRRLLADTAADLRSSVEQLKAAYASIYAQYWAMKAQLGCFL